MNTGECHGRCRFLLLAARRQRAQSRAVPLLTWNRRGLYITTGLALLILPAALLLFWEASATISCNSVNGVSAPWDGSEILSSGSFAGKCDAATWNWCFKKSNAPFLHRWQRGAERNTTSRLRKYWNAPLEEWMRPLPPDSALTSSGSAISCDRNQRGTIAPGYLRLETSSARQNMLCSSNCGRQWLQPFNNSLWRNWSRRLPTPSSTWLPACGTRTILLPCCLGSNRTISSASNNGSRNTNVCSSCLYLDPASLPRKMTGRTRPLLTDMACRVAHETLPRLEMIFEEHEGSTGLQDRPGPKSRGTRTSSDCLRCTSARTWACRSDVCSCADVRVGGNLGRSPPEATPISPHQILFEAKPHDPFSSLLDALQVGIPGTQPLHVVSLFLGLSQHRCRHFWCFVSLAACLQTAQASLVLSVCALATVFSVLLTRVLTGRRRQKWQWRVTRVCSGIYRRRRCLCVPLSSCQPVRNCCHRTTRPAVHMPSQTPSTGVVPRTSPSRLLFWVLVVSLVHLANAAPRVPPQTMPALPTLRAYGQQAQQVTASCKRSFKRAQRRALRDGTTGYRGRLHTPSSLGLRHLRPSTSNTSTPALPPDPRFRFVTWNAGGLNALRYTELLGWLQQERASGWPVHVMCVQETKWPYNAEYSNQHWFFVHSGMSQAQGGVLFIISKDLARSDTRHLWTAEPCTCVWPYNHHWIFWEYTSMPGHSPLPCKLRDVWSTLVNCLSPGPPFGRP